MGTRSDYVAAGSAWQTDRRGELADFPASRRRRTCRGQHKGGVELSRFATRWRAESRIEKVERGELMQHVWKIGGTRTVLRKALTGTCTGPASGRCRCRPESIPRSTR